MPALSSVFAWIPEPPGGAERVLLVRKRDGAWTFPGGRGVRGEDPVATLVREVREETGLQVEAGLVPAEPLVRFRREWRRPPDVALLYLVTAATGEPEPGAEIAEVGWFAPERPPAVLTTTARAFWRSRWPAVASASA